jgi:antagonist of KipI
MEMTVIRAGMLTTVQDLGRPGHRDAGVPLGGAADPLALRIANLLVGNPENAAALEITLSGPELEFSEEATLAVGGAEFAAVPSWRIFTACPHTRVRLGECLRGCRGYLAVAGGFAVEPVLGGRGTCLVAGFGGWQGRALRDGDALPIAASARHRIGSAHWSIDPRILPEYSADAVVRIVRGAQADRFFAALCGRRFRISSRSDRMGVRLEGPALEDAKGVEQLSSAVAPGTVQVPPDGQPIVLMADAQTLGGYPVAAHVANVDLPLLAQLKPGDRVGFREISLAQAHALAVAREHSLAILRRGLAKKFAWPGPPSSQA